MAPGDPEFFILKHTSWIDSTYEHLLLGAIVGNFADPIEVSIPDLEEGETSHLEKYYNGATTLDGKWSNFVSNAYSDTQREGGVVLASLGGVKFSGNTHEAVSLNGKFVRYRRVKGVVDFFDRVKRDTEVEERVAGWFTRAERLVGKATAYLVVGTMVCEEVDIEWGTDERRDAEGKLVVPLGEITAAATGVPVGGDVQVSVTSGMQVGRLFKAHSGESKVFAVQVREVSVGRLANLKRLKMTKGGLSAVEQGRVLDDEKEELEGIESDELFLVEEEEE